MAIAANELKIGNYIFGVSDRVEIVTAILGEHIQTRTPNLEDHHTDESKHYSPILLSEEWLLKLGAKKEDILITHDRFEISYHDDYKFWYVYDEFSGCYITKVEYVHEWQNVLFVLNGHELTIKQ